MLLTAITDATRPLISVMLIATTCYLAIIGKLDAKDFVSLVTIVVLFWFKEKWDAKASEQTLDQLRQISGTGNVQKE